MTHVGLQRFAGSYADAMPRGPRIVVGNMPRGAAVKGVQQPDITTSNAGIMPKRISARDMVATTRKERPNGK